MVRADGVLADVENAKDKSSANYSKDKQFLPGEEVVTPTGQKMRVWSTTGPVPVSPPPQPFDDPSKATIDSAIIEVDSGVAIPRTLPPGPPTGTRPGRRDRFDYPNRK